MQRLNHSLSFGETTYQKVSVWPSPGEIGYVRDGGRLMSLPDGAEAVDNGEIRVLHDPSFDLVTGRSGDLFKDSGGNFYTSA